MDAVKSVLNSPVSPVGILINMIVLFYGRIAAPTVPVQFQWVFTNYVTQVLILGIMTYKSGIVGDNLQMSLMLAGAVVAGLNVVNGGSAFGDLKMPFM
jgi:hypothetical protein